jgi:chemotaxis family two-component system sensor kinase Cph1
MQSTIENCDLEPIHALGLIQAHGALVAFDRAGLTVARSANAASLLGHVPGLGMKMTDAHFDQTARDAIARGLEKPELVEEGVQCFGAGNRRFDLVMHWSDGLLLAEWEEKPLNAPPTTHYANLVQQSIQQLQRSAASSLGQLLQVATDAIRTLTGFDRVMAYQFLQDGSGSVSAESKRAQLAPYLHLRYPAGDIPAQARRLYVVNAIRHIANVREAPVPIEPAIVPANGKPLDLTHSILRSVSPIHIEYLKNMGVAASMSVSIVVDGKLWGLIACHHMEPLSVPHAVRVSCTVLAQVLSITVERNELSQRAMAERRIEDLRGQVANALASSEDFNIGEINLAYLVTPALQLGTAYTYTRGSSIGSISGATYSQVNLAANYALSVRTDLYLVGIYQHASGKDSTGKTAVAAISNLTNSSSDVQTALIFGIRHKF